MPDFNSIHGLSDLIKTTIEFLVGTVVIKYIIVKWVAEQIKKLFVIIFVRSKREVAIWLHYENKRKREKKQLVWYHKNI